MRDLKFRVWVNDHWVDWIPTCKTLGAYNASIIDTDGYTFEEDNSFIVEQYTGLKDRNGKEIYEGDIVRVSYGYNYEVRQFKSGAWRIGRDDLCVWADSSEVIGNIHENPELVGGEE